MPSIGTYQFPLHENRPIGPFLVGTNLYAVVLSSGTVVMRKSTDGGSTWATAGTAPTIPAETIVSVSATVSGATIHALLTVDEQTATGEAYASFATGTDAWSAASALGPYTENRGAAGATFSVPFARSGGDVIVVNTGKYTSMGVGYARPQFSRYAAGAWASADTMLEAATTAIHMQPRSACLGSSDRMHVFWTSDTAGTLIHRAVTSSNTLGTQQTVDSTVTGTAVHTTGQAVSFTYSAATRIAVPYVDSNGDLRLAYATSADAPTWSTSLISSTVKPEYTNSNPASLVFDGTDLHCLWVADSDQTLYQATSTDGGATWGSATQKLSGITITGLSAGMAGTSTIGYVYQSGTSVVYDSISLSTGPVTLTVAGTSAGVGTATAAAKVTLTAAGTSAGTSTATGNATQGTTLAVSGATAGTSTATGSVTQSATAAGASASTSTVTGSTTATATTAGASSGTATAAASATITATVSGASAGTSTATGAATQGQVLTASGTSAGTSTATGATTATATVAATSAGTSTATGAISQAVNVAGTSAGTSTVTGNATAETSQITYDVAGSAAGTSTTTGTTTQASTIAAASAGASTVAGSVTQVVTVAGASAGTSTVTGNAEAGITQVTYDVAGSAAGASSATAATKQASTVAGASAGTSTATGAATTSIVLTVSGSSAGMATAAADTRIIVNASGAVVGMAVTSANATVTMLAGGTSAGTSVVSDALTAMWLSVSGDAVGLSIAAGNAEAVGAGVPMVPMEVFAAADSASSFAGSDMTSVFTAHDTGQLLIGDDPDVTFYAGDTT